ncbi:PepSY-associated TM helix domain-containing protein [Roseateles saccharophilus]|uniref:Putative iron-regulated membrane protein n=1 Tax=Roseateles saccharophilus TaxID=304 RepID=A0A4R3URT8_ROSSA|nr:PepSY-associated TM helix domain-containing protein [Roseateles saccharophilus]MDG0833187.1 PepSY domain-containing protein [Roseateles saccharophilus]TCU94655.1 putative iron-regulated membrane protein [Roseateles saccharophilus]
MRRFWLLLHRWLALALGLPLIAVALLGSSLVVLRPLDRWMNAELFSVPVGPAASDLLERTRGQLQAEFGPGASFVLRPPRLAGESLRVTVRGPWDGFVYLDPRDARELGRRGEREGLFNFVFELHSGLLMNDAGRPLLAVLALTYVMLLIGGLVMWWPKLWNQAFTLALDRGLLRGLFDLHRAGGAVLGVLIAVPVASGAYMAWKPLSQAVTSLSGEPPLAPPRVKLTVPASPPASLDALVATAVARFDGAPVGYIALPAGAAKPVRVRLMLADDPHPNGLTSVWLHPQTGAVLRADRWNELDLGARANSVVYPLHTGELGGLAHEALNALLGLTLAALGVAGLWVWWLRRPRRSV